ncbi:OsmC family protein [Halorubrum sp. AD140]|uniref:OsmC family protein n=1 Tax=Halorubrum sp. AD140 TaxID=3050073 RepID=UPI002ACCE538|nr:OsmC family protein [Halorubrum sp. AD140]MDZ5811299.1 OsmC family protein [Halorubrum sp. AD140]
MSDVNLREEQEPLKREYEENPDAAKITLTATGAEQDDVRSCSVDIGRAIYEAELHEGAGGPGAAACSGDLLLGALAACSQLTAQAVAENFGVDVDVSVEASGDLDLRGTLGIDDDVRVGFEEIRLDVTVDGDLDEDTRAALQKYTERYCVVHQTLADAPEPETTWEFS